GPDLRRRGDSRRRATRPRKGFSVMNPVDIGQLSPVTRMREAGLTVAPIPRARTSTVAGLRRLVATDRRPAIFTGLTDGWTAHTSWQPDELRRRHGDTEV